MMEVTKESDVKSRALDEAVILQAKHGTIELQLGAIKSEHEIEG